jgi:hypothetical protein
MESTGVYRIPLFQILEERGLNVCLFNAHYVKNVPGRQNRCLRLSVAPIRESRYFSTRGRAIPIRRSGFPRLTSIDPTS